MSPQMPAGARRLARGIDGMPARAAFVVMIALLAGCSSSATPSPKATSTQSAPAAASTPAAPRTFTSRHYGYTGALPAGWSSGTQATQQWDGHGAPGDEDSVVDLFSGPGGVEAWAMAAPTKQSLAAYTTATTRASAAAHPCPAPPQTNQAITIGGEPARLLNMQCPAGGGFLTLPLPHRSDTAVQALHFPAQRHQFPQLPLAPGIRRAGLGHARVRFSRRPADGLGLHCQVCG